MCAAWHPLVCNNDFVSRSHESLWPLIVKYEAVPFFYLQQSSQPDVAISHCCLFSFSAAGCSPSTTWPWAACPPYICCDASGSLLSILGVCGLNCSILVWEASALCSFLLPSPNRSTGIESRALPWMLHSYLGQDSSRPLISLISPFLLPDCSLHTGRTLWTWSSFT